MSPTTPRKRASWLMASVMSISFCSAVRTRTPAASKRGRSGATQSGIRTPSASLSTASYSARLPMPINCVSARYRSGMKTRGPIVAAIPGSPGTLMSEARMTNRAKPITSVSPMLASSEMSSDGSTYAFLPSCSAFHAPAGSVMTSP